MPTSYDYLSLRYIDSSTYDFATSPAGNTAECSASFSGSESLFHAESSSQGTYVWDSNDGTITLNNGGNYYIHGVAVVSVDGGGSRSGDSVGYMGVSASATGKGGLPVAAGGLPGGLPLTLAQHARLAYLGSAGLVAHGPLADFGSDSGASRADHSPRSHPYQMFLSGVVAGTVIKPTYRNLGSIATPVSPLNSPTSDDQNIQIGTTFIIQNFPDETINQSYVFTALDMTGSTGAVIGPTTLQGFPSSSHWSANVDRGGATGKTAFSASYGFESNITSNTGSFAAGADLVSAALTEQKYVITAIDGLGGQGSTSPASDYWGFFTATDRFFHVSTFYSGKRATGVLTQYAANRRGLTGFSPNMGITSFAAVDVPKFHSAGSGAPEYAMTSLNPQTTQKTIDAGFFDGDTKDKLETGTFTSGSSFSIIPMSKYSTEAKNDSYFSFMINSATPLEATGLALIGGSDHTPLDFTVAGAASTSAHINLWVGAGSASTGNYTKDSSLFSDVSQILPSQGNAATTGSTEAAGESLSSPNFVVTSSGITVDYLEGKITVNYDGMYILKQYWNSVAMDGTSATATELDLTVRKNATSASATHASGNYLVGTPVYESTVMADKLANAGWGSGFCMIAAFTASAGDYFTCDVLATLPSTDGDYKLHSAGGISLSLYRIGDIPGFADPVPNHGLSLFNRDLSVIDRYTVTNQYSTSYTNDSHQVPYILGSRGISTIRDREDPPAPQIGQREIIRKKRR